MLDPTTAVRLAARNNAEWCDAVCRAHGCQTTFHPSAWRCLTRPPRFHSDLVTLVPFAEDFVRQARPHGFKDSFCDINGPAFGYSTLFEAEWIAAETGTHGTTELEWKRVTSDSELLQWEAGWADGDADAAHYPRQFPPSLLTGSNLEFWGGYDADRLVAGAGLNVTGPAVGVSNVFGGLERAAIYGEVLALIGTQHPGQLAVGYERDDDLAAAMVAGFRTVGSLRVLIR